jgi:hypothetical protein
MGIVWLQLMTAHVDTLVRMFCEIRDRDDEALVRVLGGGAG